MESKYLKSKINISRRLVNKLLEKFEYVSILGKEVSGKVFRMSNFEKNIADSPDKSCGFVVRIYHQGLYSEYSFNDISEDNFEELINKISSLSLSSNILKNKMDLSVLKDEPLKKDYVREMEGKRPSIEEIVTKLNEIKDKMKKADEKVIQAITLLSYYDVSSFFISKNRELTQSFSWCQLYLVSVVRKEEDVKQLYTIISHNSIEKCLKDGFEKAEETTKTACELLNSEHIIPGTYDIIASPEITGLIAHEAFGHGVEMDMYVKKRAKSRMYINKPVASPLVNMRDGAASILCNSSYFFDDEGVIGHDTLIIDKGILKTGICDAVSANELNKESTGNGRRENFSRKAYTRMTNTFFEPGKDKLEDMIASIKHGYLLCNEDNGMEDPKNWNIQCTCSFAREIKDGKLTGKIVSPVVMTGYVPDLLMSISMVGDEFHITGSGYCGKGHKEWVPTATGGPYIKARCKLS